MSKPRSILLLCDDRKGHAGNVLQHIEALRRRSRHDVRLFNPVGTDGTGAPPLDGFDVVAVHYTLVVTIDRYLPPALRERITRFRGLKVQFIQDEYRWIDEITAAIRELGIELLFTLVPEAEVAKIYGPRLPATEIVTTLAGYVPGELLDRPTPPLHSRLLDVGYRGRTVPYWLGRLGQEKAEIGRGFLARAPGHGLRCDIGWSETDRLYGERWIRFLTSCRATLGTESGATIADFDGSVEQAVRDYLADRPTASFDEVERDVLAPYEGNVELKVISPRQFEAAALRTALVLFPGGYSGILEPDRHYIPLAKDFSNFGEVAERLRDLTALQALVDRAHEDLVESGRYSLEAFVRQFDDLVDERSPAPARPGPPRRPARAPTRRGFRRLAHDPAYRSLSTLLGWRLIARRGALRRLALAWARNGKARRDVAPHRLHDDLLKLALLLDAQSGRATGQPFRLRARYDPSERRLMLGSRTDVRGGDAAPAPDPTVLAAIARSLRNGSLQEIAWNHTAIGDHVWVPLAAGRKLAVAVGYHGMSGIHSFRGLVLLAPRFPDLVFAALEPLLCAEELVPAGELEHAR